MSATEGSNVLSTKVYVFLQLNKLEGTAEAAVVVIWIVGVEVVLSGALVVEVGSRRASVRLSSSSDPLVAVGCELGAGRDNETADDEMGSSARLNARKSREAAIGRMKRRHKSAHTLMALNMIAAVPPAVDVDVLI